MSIITGFVSKNCGLVASDGRIMTPLEFQNGVPINQRQIADDHFNKTFSIDGGYIIGAWAGLMKFGDKKISEHLEEILENDCQEIDLMDETINTLIRELQIRLNNIPAGDIRFEFRKVDLIFIASPSGSSNDLQIYTAKISPNLFNNALLIERKILKPDKKKDLHWQTFGDDAAQNAIKHFLQQETEKTQRKKNALTHLIKSYSCWKGKLWPASE
jgi:hypothetical protein